MNRPPRPPVLRPPLFGHPGELVPPPGLVFKGPVWLVWPLGRPEQIQRLGARSARAAVEAFARLVDEVPAHLVCVDANGRRLSHWTGRPGPASAEVWARCPRPRAGGRPSPEVR